MKKYIRTTLIGLLFLSAASCGSTNFFDLSTENTDMHFPGEPSGTDALSSSTNMSGKEGDTAPKLDPLSGAVYLPAPSVGNYGTVNISYPIEIPSSRGGMSPSVGVSYSSSGGDGLAGIGWSFSGGLPAISRTTSNGELYYDSRDTFTFNGKRLVKVSGSATSEDGVYRAEIESDFTRFELRNSTSGGIWYAMDKSGAVTVLGETSDSKIYKPDNINKTYIWNFSRSFDLNGNSMNALYDTSGYAENHILYLKEIRYGGNTCRSLDGKQWVRFEYKDREDAYVSKAAGFIMRMERILDGISVGWSDSRSTFGSDTELWHYTFVYTESPDSGRPLLKTIESNKRTTKPEFFYQEAVHSFSWQKVTNPWAADAELDSKKSKFFEGDFNGDGISDVVVFNPKNGEWKAAEGKCLGGYLFKTYGNKFQGYDSVDTIQFFKGNVTGDYNGDGRSDIAFYLTETREFVVAEHDGRVFHFVKYGKLINSIGNIFSSEWFSGDYDGNGLSDALLFDETTGEWTLMRNTGGAFSFQIISRHFKNVYRDDFTPNGDLNSPSTTDESLFGKNREKIQFLSGDYNGDGRTDLAVYDARNGKWYVGENFRDETNYFTIKWKLYKVFSVPDAALFANEHFSGDFNGDGFSDFLIFNRTTGEWTIGETGDGTITFKIYSKIPSEVRRQDVSRWLQGDFNGDGKTDIGFYAGTTGNFWIGEAARNGFRYRIYNNISYGGPDGDRVLAKAPVPEDEVVITVGKDLVPLGASSSVLMNYSFDGNYHSYRGEKVFAGDFDGNGTSELFGYKRKDNTFFTINSANEKTPIIDLNGIDLDYGNIEGSGNYASAGKIVRTNGRSSVQFFHKSSANGYDTYSFNVIQNNSGNWNNSTFASIKTNDINFETGKSIYTVSRRNGAGLSLVLLDDAPQPNETGFTPHFYVYVNNSGTKCTIAGAEKTYLETLLMNARNKRTAVRTFAGDDLSEIYLCDGTKSAHEWYKGTVSGSTITFTKITGTANFASTDLPETLSYRLWKDGSVTKLVYGVPSVTDAVFGVITLGETVSQKTVTADGKSWSGWFDGSSRPVVSGTDGVKAYDVYALSPAYSEVAQMKIERPDLYNETYPFDWIQGDYNGDGKTDIGFFAMKESQWYFALTKGTVPDMIDRVNNGIGGAYLFEYANSSSFDNTGDDDVPDLPMNYKVCTKVTLDDGFGRREPTTYEYKNGCAYSAFVNGKKETDYFGFSEFTVVDPTGSKTTNYYNTTPYDDFRKNRALAGAVKESVFLGSDVKEYARTKYEYTLHEIRENSTQSPSFLIEPTKVVKYMHGVLFETRTSTITLASSGYEMVSQLDTVTDHYSDGVHSAKTRKSYAEFSNNSVTNEMRVIYQRNLFQSNEEVTTQYYYDTHGNVINEYTSYTGSGLQTPQPVSKRYEYDEYGNRTHEINESGTPNRIVERVFDDVLHQYVVEERALGNVTLTTKYEINYGSAFGAPDKKTDPNGSSIWYDYDEYGRLKKQRMDTDDGVETLAEYSYDAASTPIRGKVIQYDGDGGKKETSIYADGFGRTLQSVWSVTEESGRCYAKSGEVTFDALGRVVRKGQTQWADDGDIDEYNPSTETNPTLTEYDASGRVMKVTLPKAYAGEKETSTTYTYNDPWETVVMHSIGRSKKTTVNASGEVLYVEDYGTGDDGSTDRAKMGFACNLSGKRIKKMDLNDASMNLSINEALYAPGAKDTSGNNICQWKYDGFGRVTETSDADLGYGKAEYNGFGEITIRTDAQNRKTFYYYDRLGRMTNKKLPGNEGEVTYTYDSGADNALGRLVEMKDPAQTKKLIYDKVGRVKKEVRSIPSEEYAFETTFTYDLLNRTKTISLPEDPETKERVTTEYSYAPCGVTGIRLTQGLQSKVVVGNVTYNEFGQMESLTQGNNTTTSYEYDIRGRATRMRTVNTETNTELQNVTYAFRVDNSIEAKDDTTGADSAGSPTTNYRHVRYEYSYDGLNRLVDAQGEYIAGASTGSATTDTSSAKKFRQGFDYSPSGNITEKKIYDTTTNTVDDAWSYSYASGTSTSSVTDAAGHAVQGIHSTKSGNRLTFEYDASGNTVYENDSVKNKAKEITYDSNNRMTKVVDPNTGKTIGEYEYDDGGFRVRKLAAEIINGAEAKVEVLYPSMYFGIERQLASDGCTIPNTAYAVNNIYMNGVRIAAALANGTCQYYLTDQVDSVSVVVNDTGSILTRTEYLPYGEAWFQEGEVKNRPKFNSQELDAETGFYFYNARHYDGEIGRFVTADNVIDGEYDTQGWNRYGYCKGNPIRYKDPTGHSGRENTLNSDSVRHAKQNDKLKKEGEEARKRIKDENEKAKAEIEKKIEKVKSKIDKFLNKSDVGNTVDKSVSKEDLRSSRLKQSDPSINTEDKKMAKAGCNFRASQAVAEEYVGRNLTADEINAARKKLQSGSKPPVSEDMSVKDPDAVINDAFKRLGRSDVTATVNWGAENGQSPNSKTVFGQTDPNDSSKLHFKTGNADGQVSWDPARNVTTTNDRSYPVYLHFQPPKE